MEIFAKDITRYIYKSKTDSVVIEEHGLICFNKEQYYYRHSEKDPYLSDISPIEGDVVRLSFWLRERDDKKAKKIIDDYLLQRAQRGQAIGINNYEVYKRSELGVDRTKSVDLKEILQRIFNELEKE